MIENLKQLNAALFQLSSFVDMLEALQMDCQQQKDFTLFPLVSEGYLHRIRELNGEIREYLSSHSEVDSEPVGVGATSTAA